METANIFPSKFAMSVCRKVGLYGVDITKSGGDHSAMDMSIHFGLTEFQQMVVGGATFESALLAFYGTKLNDDQIAVLKVVEQSTVPWIMGHVAGTLAQKLQSSSNKDIIAAAQILVDDLIQKGGKGKELGETARRLIVQMDGDFSPRE